MAIAWHGTSLRIGAGDSADHHVPLQQLLQVDGDAKFSFSHDLANGQNMASALGLHVNAKELNLVCRI